MDEFDVLEDEFAEMEKVLDGAAAMTAAFSSEVSKLQGSVVDAGRHVDQLSSGLSRGLKSAFDGVVFGGDTLRDALGKVAQSMIDTAYSAAVKPVTSHVGGLLAQGVEGLFSGAYADGGSFSQGRVTPFATGGVVSGPVAFPMRGGMGLMGEAGPEAIMPLSRSSDGRLGVRMDGGAARPVSVTMNISTPDVSGFQRSQGQIAAQMTRALGRAERNR